ncbi:EamA family transporter [Virgibacillus halodenitrificans]|uniref:EamA family transporter n=1 Tax=Virgibacillus halodenitrificans TaxID=1482 RepID=A0ABR7VJU6_VIRHA|nr:EamA family transporter [Virgibacillus halodenitrificans]MBD1222209.1 EamA family transporter [Virgibacillus halodenitrificans]MCJ0930142.1 EamA family transporter [Virgibacillus halodenitrificans]MYL45865.1 EamA family transporter [Virgibacillus halodenitrificans]MYL58177.1 EamA family transporter [Virgibacillus halodenitrificans]WHX26641.1 EamA family transporter [Virgibacillus halodenitrificans]
MGYLYIFSTIFFTVYGQLILKWRMNQFGSLPDTWIAKFTVLLQLLLNPWVLSGFFAAFLAALSWMAAMTKFDISYAYPFMSLSFVFVFILSALLFGEPVSLQKVIGFSLIILGIIVMR